MSTYLFYLLSQCYWPFWYFCSRSKTWCHSTYLYQVRLIESINWVVLHALLSRYLIGLDNLFTAIILAQLNIIAIGVLNTGAAYWHNVANKLWLRSIVASPVVSTFFCCMPLSRVGRRGPQAPPWRQNFNGTQRSPSLPGLWKHMLPSAKIPPRGSFGHI